jgi:hypothetical protein
MLRDPFDKTGPGNAAAADLWAGHGFSFQHQDIKAVLGQQCCTGKSSRTGANNYH